jgi:hypothetical protein
MSMTGYDLRRRSCEAGIRARRETTVPMANASYYTNAGDSVLWNRAEALELVNALKNGQTVPKGLLDGTKVGWCCQARELSRQFRGPPGGAGWGAVAADGLAGGASDLAGAVGVGGQDPAHLVQHHVVVPPAVCRPGDYAT